MTTAALKDGEHVGPLPSVGQPIWLEDLPTGPSEVMVEEVRGAGMVRVDAPRQGGKAVPLRPGSAVRLFYHAADVPCSARATLIPAKEQSGGPWLEISHVERTQRRGAVRVPALLVARIRCESPTLDRVVATEDISSTGVLVRAADPIPRVEGTVDLLIHFGGTIGDMSVEARVVRTAKADKSARPWQIAMQFCGLARASEQTIVRFVFERQREIQSRAAGRT